MSGGRKGNYSLMNQATTTPLAPLVREARKRGSEEARKDLLAPTGVIRRFL